MTDYASRQPRYIKGVQSGYDVPADGEYGVWRFRDGRRGTKAKVLAARDDEGALLSQFAATGDPERFGFTIKSSASTGGDKIAEMENALFGEEISTVKRLASNGKPDQIPSEMLAKMRLAELYAESEGDIFQIIEAPMDLCLGPIEIECPDKALQRELEAIYDPYTGIDINQHLSQIWLAAAIYGQAFPLEVWDAPGEVKEGSNRLEWIVHLCPKYVNVGIGPSGFKLGLTNSQRRWSADAIESQLPPKAYKSFAPGWNETALSGDDIQLRPEFCQSVRDKAHNWQRYALPGMARAFRAINTRRVMEEMIRATMEGYRNQLWVFRLGAPDRPPSVRHIEAFKENIGTMSGERTGTLVWWDAPLQVDIYAPKTFEEMSGMDAWRAMTQDIFRRMGVHVRVVSGEGSASQLGGGDAELDVRILLERNKFMRRQVLNWEYHLRMNIGRYQMGGSSSTMKSLRETNVRLPRSALEIERELKEVLMPIYQSGAMSVSTLLSQSGISTYEVELAKKKEEKKDDELWGPRPTFSQTTVNPGTKPKQAESSPKGRPVDVKASFEGEPAFDELLEIVFGDFDAMLAGEHDISTFIGNLRSNMSLYAHRFASLGYRDAGGAGSVDSQWSSGAANFINSFTAGLEQALEDAPYPESLAWRVYLYPQELRNLAWMYGVQQSMRERGARAWRRVLHPEQSADGPCMDCIRDSSIVHPISEPFFEFHPHGVCSAQGVAFYTDDAEPAIEVPVPGKMTVPERILEIIKKLGDVGKSIVRRIRA